MSSGAIRRCARRVHADHPGATTCTHPVKINFVRWYCCMVKVPGLAGTRISCLSRSGNFVIDAYHPLFQIEKLPDGQKRLAGPADLPPHQRLDPTHRPIVFPALAVRAPDQMVHRQSVRTPPAATTPTSPDRPPTPSPPPTRSRRPCAGPPKRSTTPADLHTN